MISEQELLDFLGAHAQRGVPGSGLSRAIGKAIPQSLRPAARVFATKAIRPWQRRRAKQLAAQSPLRLNLGCGTLRLDGWVNIDLVGLPVDLAWSILTPFPFDDDSVDSIFHEHVLEHIPGYDGFVFLKNCHRVLKPGGIMRIVVPDASRYIASYFDPEHRFIRDFRGERPTAMLALQEEFYSFGHRAVYDHETVALFCKVIGFSKIESKAFGESALVPCPDSEWRVHDSCYTEVVK
jgi:predicted SAM-dependent methyltransferase